MALKCNNCGARFVVRPGSDGAWCPACGRSVEREDQVSPQEATCGCGAVALGDARYCARCGQPVAPEVPKADPNPAAVADVVTGRSVAGPVGVRRVGVNGGGTGRVDDADVVEWLEPDAEGLRRGGIHPAGSGGAAVPPGGGFWPDDPVMAGLKEPACPKGAVLCDFTVPRRDLDALLEELGQMRWGTTLAEQLAQDLVESDYRWVRLSSVFTLGKRCHPTGRGEVEQAIRPVARQVSQALFGFVIRRTLTPQQHAGGPLPDRLLGRGAGRRDGDTMKLVPWCITMAVGALGFLLYVLILLGSCAGGYY